MMIGYLLAGTTAIGWPMVNRLPVAKYRVRGARKEILGILQAEGSSGLVDQI